MGLDDLGKEVTSDMRIWTQMMDAVDDANPVEAMDAVLIEHREKPYFADACAKAKTMMVVVRGALGRNYEPPEQN